MKSLKSLRERQKSIQSTQKITLAMKMVSVVKLRKSQEKWSEGIAYIQKMEDILEKLVNNPELSAYADPLLTGAGSTKTHLMVVMTSDRGLCGSFNTSLVRVVKSTIQTLKSQGKTVKLLCIGQKGYELLRGEYGSLIIESLGDVGQPRLQFSDGERIAAFLIEKLQEKTFDICTLVYNHFKSAMTQVVTSQQIIPLRREKEGISSGNESVYELEPSPEILAHQFLVQHLALQIYKGLVQTSVSEHGARMKAMDTASSNAKDMLRKLVLVYNRSRQEIITRELVEIISGSETLKER